MGFFRTKLLAELRAKEVMVLCYSREDSIDVIADAFLDGNEWLKTFREGIDNIGDLVGTLHCHHAVEVLTMFFCLFGDSEVLVAVTLSASAQTHCNMTS